MTKEEALDTIWMRCQHNDKTYEAFCILKRELGLIELDGGDRVKPEVEPKYCDRNICLSNEYSGINCDECEVMKSQEPCEDYISFPKGTLKMRGKGYIVYNYDWLKENWQIELKILGIDWKEQMQEPILDQIRAEIEEQKEARCFDDDDMFVYRTGLDDALYIIDKYKAESEDGNENSD